LNCLNSEVAAQATFKPPAQHSEMEGFSAACICRTYTPPIRHKLCVS
jgi:hypothetical protein